MQEVVELQVQLARLNAKLDEAENARRVLDTARRDLEKDINIKVVLIAHALRTLKIYPHQGIELFMRAGLF